MRLGAPSWPPKRPNGGITLRSIHVERTQFSVTSMSRRSPNPPLRRPAPSVPVRSSSLLTLIGNTLSSASAGCSRQLDSGSWIQVQPSFPAIAPHPPFGLRIVTHDSPSEDPPPYP